MQYMVRVELYNYASRDDYNRLHAAMLCESFSRTLTAEGTGKRYEALTGTYWIEAMSDGLTVLEKARRAAASIYSAFGVMVAGSGHLYFLGCPEEKPVQIPLMSPLTGLAALAHRTSPFASLASIPAPPSTLGSAFCEAFRRR